MVKGLRSPDPLQLDLMRTYSASPAQVLAKLRLPASRPFLFASLKVGVAASLVGTIVAEVTKSEDGGLGARLLAGLLLRPDDPDLGGAAGRGRLRRGAGRLVGLVERLTAGGWAAREGRAGRPLGLGGMPASGPAAMTAQPGPASGSAASRSGSRPGRWSSSSSARGRAQGWAGGLRPGGPALFGPDRAVLVGDGGARPRRARRHPAAAHAPSRPRLVAVARHCSAQDFLQTFKGLAAGYRARLAAAGALVAVLIDRVPFLQRGLLPLGTLVSALPIVGIAPIMVMWFGFDWQSKAAVVAIMTFFPMLVNCNAGLAATSQTDRDLMSTYAASYGGDAAQAAPAGRLAVRLQRLEDQHDPGADRRHRGRVLRHADRRHGVPHQCRGRPHEHRHGLGHDRGRGR